jgi:methylase of polypeptide subunit release factors
MLEPAGRTVNDNITQPIRASYDRLADEYARRIFNELQHKAPDRDLLDRLAADIAGRGEVCDMGSGPGHIAATCATQAQTFSAWIFLPQC